MIRSAEHLTWEAYMVTGPVRAELRLRMTAAERAMRAAVRAASLTFEEASRGVLALGRALRRAGVTVEEASRR